MAQQDDQRAVKAARATVHMLEGTLNRIRDLEENARTDRVLLTKLRDLIGAGATIGSGYEAKRAHSVIDLRVEQINALLAPLKENPLG